MTGRAIKLDMYLAAPTEAVFTALGERLHDVLALGFVKERIERFLDASLMQEEFAQPGGNNAAAGVRPPRDANCGAQVERVGCS